MPVRASPTPTQSTEQPQTDLSSPTRPNFLPISEPIPVPTQRVAFERMRSQKADSKKSSDEQQPSSSPLEVSEFLWDLIIFRFLIKRMGNATIT